METTATVAELTAAVNALIGAFNTFAADVNQTIADIIAKEQQGGTITAAELGPIKDSLTTLSSSVAAADAVVKGEDPGKVPAAAPVKPVYVHDVEGATEGWTPSGFEVPAVAAVAEVPASPAGPDGEPEVPATPAQAEVPAKPLWYFTADTEGGQPTGAEEGVWTVYAGPVVAVPAA